MRKMPTAPGKGRPYGTWILTDSTSPKTKPDDAGTLLLCLGSVLVLAKPMNNGSNISSKRSGGRIADMFQRLKDDLSTTPSQVRTTTVFVLLTTRQSRTAPVQRYSPIM
jgi:hypothetical protein